MRTKYEFNIFSVYDYEHLSKKFEDMSEQGWHLVKLGRFITKYKKGECTRWKYNIRVLEKFFLFENPQVDKFEQLRREAINKYWLYMTSCGMYHVFKHKDLNQPDLSYDVTEDYRTVDKKIKINWVIIAFITFILLLLLKGNVLYVKLYKLIISNEAMVGGLMMLILYSDLFFDMISSLNWKNKTIENNSKYHYSEKFIKNRSIFKIFSFFFIILSCLYLLTTTHYSAYLTPVVIVIIAFILSKWIKATRIDKDFARVLSFNIFFIATIFVCVFLNTPVKVEIDKSLVNLRDFKIYDDTIRVKKDIKTSIIVEENFYYSEYSMLGQLSAETVKFKDNGLKDYYVKNLLRDYSYEQVSGNNIYYEDKGKSLLVIKDNNIYVIKSSFDLADKNNIDIVKNKLGL